MPIFNFPKLYRYLLICFTLVGALRLSPASATTIVDGDNLFKLIGKSKSDPVVKEFISKLGIRDNSLSSSTVWTYPQDGIRIGFYKGEMIDRIMLYDNAYAVGSTRFSAYSKKLPKKLAWFDTKSSTILKLGVPAKDYSNYLEYNGFPVEMILYYNGNRIKSKLSGVLLRFKHCVRGDCQNGEGLYVMRDGTRYEGGWKNGKRHGEGKLVYESGLVKEGVWEEGVYRGENFFVSNGLYNLLGKHEDSKEVRSSAESKKAGYQKVKLAYDYVKYVFNQNSLKFYFNDYGYLYKISVNESGFKDFKHKLTENVPRRADHNYVKYIMGSPYKKYEYCTGSTWVYKDKGYDLRIRFDKRDIISAIDVRVEDETILTDESKGECKSGNCVDGYGEFVSESGRYVGSFKKGKYDGKGTMYYKSGGYYKGAFKNGLRNGYGVYIWSDNSRYVGNWKENQKHGRGSMFYQNKSKYSGQWYQNQRHGSGAMYYPNGNHYIGEWYFNSQTGKGTFYYSSGKSQTGRWKNGVLETSS